MAQMSTDEERIVALLHDAVEDGRWYTLSAVDALTKRTGERYDDYLDRVKTDALATKVKLADLKDNSDLSRLGRDPTDEDRRRLDKYLRARAILQASQEGK
jgi:guanosine-3',5'-bis(diphosphate) 3'-pyrophosphohydrolase